MTDDAWYVKVMVVAIAVALFTISVLLWIGVFEFIGWIAQ